MDSVVSKRRGAVGVGSLARIIAVASSKGGVGKTLVSMVLGSRLASGGLRVAAIDADPNGALADWRANVWDGPAFVVEAEPDAARLAPAHRRGGEIADQKGRGRQLTSSSA